jgi:hypothetical protein
MAREQRKRLMPNQLVRILRRRGWHVRRIPPWGSRERLCDKYWDFIHGDNSLYSLNPKAGALLRDYEQHWRDPIGRRAGLADS